MKPDAPVDPTITTRFALAEVTQCAGTAPTGPKRYANTITSNNSTRKSNVDVLAYLSLTLLPPTRDGACGRAGQPCPRTGFDSPWIVTLGRV